MERLPQMLALRRTAELGWLRALPIILVLVMVPLDLVVLDVHLWAVIAAMPPLAALVNGPRTTAAVALTAVASCILLRITMNPGAPEHLQSELVTVVLIGAASVLIAFLRDRVLARLLSVDMVSQVAQQALLPRLPRRVGGLDCAVRSQGADAESPLGGDFFDLIDTPWGVRAVIGDVSGHGLKAVATTAAMLGSFREGALDDFDLHGLGVRLERRMRLRNDGSGGFTEEFATALLMAFPADGGFVELRSFGHHAPLLLRGAEVEPIPVRPAPPLGLLGEEHLQTLAVGRSLEPGDVVVAYTDGLIEARDRTGREYPLVERLRERLAAGEAFPGPAAVVDFLFADVREQGYRVTDDMAVLAVRVRPA
ncbi:PP2C family protein-serine/threonine phosphatase [Glycomyces endophyticus]|uniref:PP2C family protein-serine/threonine phosphatase n=1 Tax=Glycomyces endophyticus TaxID=480996 RepID=A0ABN2GLA2_9ACTN